MMRFINNDHHDPTLKCAQLCIEIVGHYESNAMAKQTDRSGWQIGRAGRDHFLKLASSLRAKTIAVRHPKDEVFRWSGRELGENDAQRNASLSATSWKDHSDLDPVALRQRGSTCFDCIVLVTPIGPIRLGGGRERQST